jgi:hypothetical protein
MLWKGGTEHIAIVVIRLSWRVYILKNYKTINAIMQPPLPVGWPPSVSMGVAVPGSESEVSKRMERSTVKRFIGVCVE